MNRLVIDLEYAKITLVEGGESEISAGVSIRDLREALEAAQVAVNRALAEMEGNA